MKEGEKPLETLNRRHWSIRIRANPVKPALAFKVNHKSIFKRWNALEIISKQAIWVRYDLKLRDAEPRLFALNNCLSGKKDGFLIASICVITMHSLQQRDDKNITGLPSHASTPLACRNIQAEKVLLSIWPDEGGVIYCELLKPNESVIGE